MKFALLLHVPSPLRRLAIIMAAGRKKTAIKSLSLRFLNQDILLLPMLRLRQILLCIISCNNWCLSLRITCPRNCSFLVLLAFFLVSYFNLPDFEDLSMRPHLKGLNFVHTLFVQRLRRCPI